MAERLVVAAAVVVWLVALVKTFELRRGRTPAAAWLWGVLVLLALAFTLFAGSRTYWLERHTGIPQVSDVLARTAVLGAVACAQALLREVTAAGGGRPRWRRGALLLAASLLVMWAAFGVGTASGGVTFGSHADVSTWPVLYLLAFVAYLGFALVDVMLGCLRFSRSASGPLATGLRLLCAGCGFGLGYLGVKVLAVIMAASGAAMPPSLEAGLGAALVIATGALIALGSLWSSIGRRVRELGPWRRAHWVHRELYPLWRALMATTPALALEPPRAALLDACRVRDMDMRVYRRVIEIRDARLELRPQLDAAVAARASARVQALGLEGADAEAYVEARVLESAIAAAQRRRMVADQWASRGPDEGSVASEIEWLLAVARHFRAGDSTAEDRQPGHRRRAGVA